MSSCTASCLATAPSFDYGGCSLQDAIRSGYIKHFVAFRCDAPVTDITDDVEIAAIYTADKAFTSAELSEAEIPFANLSDEITENCKAPIPLKRTYNFNWKTYRVDNATLTDGASYNSLDNKLGTWRIMPVTCDGVALVRQDFGTGEVPGFEMQGTISAVLANSSAMYYEGQLSFVYNDVVNFIQLTDAVLAEMGISL